jgi:hypothetical protein
MKIKNLIAVIICLIIILTSCKEEPDEYLYQQHAIHHFNAHFSLYVIPDALDTIILKELDSIEIERTLKQIFLMTENISYDIYGYSFTLEDSHLEDNYIEFEQNKNLYEIIRTNNQQEYSDSFSKLYRQYRDGKAKEINSSDKVYYSSIKYKYYNGAIIDFIIYYKGQENIDFEKKSDDDTARFLDNEISNRIYYLDWSKIYDERRKLNDTFPVQRFEKDIIRN